MDVFAFASHSEIQWMVVAEAMAAGLPVVAVSAPGIREVVIDGDYGRLLDRHRSDDVEEMVDALVSLQEPQRRLPLCESALVTAATYDEARCAERCLAVYRQVIAQGGPLTHADDGGWDRIRSRLSAEWHMLCYRGRLLKRLVRSELSEHGPAWLPENSEGAPNTYRNGRQ